MDALNVYYNGLVFLDAGIFYIIKMPMFFLGIVLWDVIGRVGAKVSIQMISYINITLLVLLALFLEYEGLNITSL